MDICPHQQSIKLLSKLNLWFTDVDECTDGSHNCDANAACTNVGGSFTCACNSGYTGDGTSCAGKNKFGVGLWY